MQKWHTGLPPGPMQLPPFSAWLTCDSGASFVREPHARLLSADGRRRRAWMVVCKGVLFVAQGFGAGSCTAEECLPRAIEWAGRGTTSG